MTRIGKCLRLAALMWLVAVVAAAPLSAQFAEDRLADPALEARAYDLHKQLRCLVCQNQSIADSNADLARDLRIIVRERVTAGDSDRQVLDYMVARYGDWVLMKPPFKIATALLWLGPGLAFLLAAGVVFVAFRRGRRPLTAGAPLSDEESAVERRLRRRPLGPGALAHVVDYHCRPDGSRPRGAGRAVRSSEARRCRSRRIQPRRIQRPAS